MNPFQLDKISLYINYFIFYSHFKEITHIKRDIQDLNHNMKRIEEQLALMKTKQDRLMEAMGGLTKDLHNRLKDDLRYLNTRMDRFLYFFMAGVMGVVGKWIYDVSEKNQGQKHQRGRLGVDLLSHPCHQSQTSNLSLLVRHSLWLFVAQRQFQNLVITEAKDGFIISRLDRRRSAWEARP